MVSLLNIVEIQFKLTINDPQTLDSHAFWFRFSSILMFKFTSVQLCFSIIGLKSFNRHSLYKFLTKFTLKRESKTINGDSAWFLVKFNAGLALSWLQFTTGLSRFRNYSWFFSSFQLSLETINTDSFLFHSSNYPSKSNSEHNEPRFYPKSFLNSTHNFMFQTLIYPHAIKPINNQ